MKVVGLREAKQKLSHCIDAAQREGVVITRHGKPAAVVVGLEGYDMEDVAYMTDPEFWRMIDERRKETRTIPIAEVRRQLGLPPFKKRARKSGGKRAG